MAAGQETEDRRYRIIKVLGRGGMGQVYLAEKLGLDGQKVRDVVLKTIIPTGTPEDIARRKEMFLREMKVAAKLEHRNIVRVTGWGKDLFGSEHFFEMERVKGISLLALLAAQGVPLDESQKWGPLPAQDVAWIGMQAAAGLHYAHTFANTDESRRGGVAHRDISPDNLMGDVNGEVKIADWGITKAVDDEGVATKTKTFAGKIKYMSPEQFSGSIDIRSDIYSLGVTLTTLLTGRHVFTAPPGTNEHGFAVLIYKGERSKVTELAPDAPPALQDLLERMMQVDREKRPSTAAEVADECEGIALELGGRLSAVQRAFAKRITPHFKRGQATIPETRGMEPDSRSVSVPVKSTRRPISAATVPDSPAQNKTQPLAIEPTAQMPGVTEPSAPGVAVDAPAESKQRPLLLGALAGSSLLLLALVTGLVAFMASGPTETTEEPSATTESAEAGDGRDETPTPERETAGPGSTSTEQGPADSPATEPPTVAADPPTPDGTEPEERIADAPETAQIQVVVVPYGEARLDGRRITLRRQHEVPAGQHRVTATFEGQHQTRNVDLEPGDSERVVFRFRAR